MCIRSKKIGIALTILLFFFLAMSSPVKAEYYLEVRIQLTKEGETFFDDGSKIWKLADIQKQIADTVKDRPNLACRIFLVGKIDATVLLATLDSFLGEKVPEATFVISDEDSTRVYEMKIKRLKNLPP